MHFLLTKNSGVWLSLWHDGKKNVPVWYSRGLCQGCTGQKDAREAGKTSGGPV